jgi:hypothetical protein
MAELATLTNEWHYGWAYFFAFILLLNAVLMFTPAAHAICEQGGFPQPRNQPFNVYVYLFAGCQLMVGLSVATLIATDEWRGVSVILACATPMGVLGTTLSATMGSGGSAFWTHVVLLGVGTMASYRLVQENW